MSRDRELAADALQDASQLRDWILQGAKGPTAQLGVGTEHEKVGFANLQGDPISYFGENGICRLLELLSERFGWTKSYDGGHLLALERNGAAITLEPGGQLELSGAIVANAFEMKRELQEHLREVRSVSRELGLEWMFVGMNPWHAPEDIAWLPKPRYTVMKSYLPRRGPLAPWMMKTTASIQANFDFRDEADAMEMLRIGGLASPLLTALFANSPIKESKETGLASYRMAIWEDTDRERCGTPAFLIAKDSGVDDYVQWVLDVPMFFIKRGDQYIDMAGASFRRFMNEGYEGHHATIGDWELHLSTAFPDIRLKQYIETRTTDVAMPDHIVALTALWKGIFYDQEARAEVLSLPLARDFTESEALIRLVREEGLAGTFRGGSVRTLTSELVGIASRGLSRQASKDGDESELLACLWDASGALVSPGETFLKDWRAANGAPSVLIPQWGITDKSLEF